MKWNINEDDQTENFVLLDETDDADKALLLENYLQLKKVKKLQYMISQDSTYRNIVMWLDRDLKENCTFWGV